MSPRWIKRLREAAGLTQEQFAKRLDCCQGSVSLWENGEREPGGRFCLRMCDLAQRHGVELPRVEKGER